MASPPPFGVPLLRGSMVPVWGHTGWGRGEVALDASHETALAMARGSFD